MFGLKAEKKKMHRGSIFLGSGRERNRLCGGKLLSNDHFTYAGTYSDINQSSKWLTENLREHSKGKFVWCWHLESSVCVCARMPAWFTRCVAESTVIPAASTAALYTSHLQRLASVVETRTIFNWPSKHSGQQREESGLPQWTTAPLPVCHSHHSFLSSHLSIYLSVCPFCILAPLCLSNSQTRFPHDWLKTAFPVFATCGFI